MSSHPLYDLYNNISDHSKCFYGNLGVTYNLRYDSINFIRCNNWCCPRCRKLKKYLLYLQVYYLCKSLNLNKHFVITFGGKKFRDKYGYVNSYYVMSHIWNKFKMVIEYKYGPMNYILFPRSQGDGFCHYHIIIDSFISWSFLEEKRKLYSNEGIGWMRIGRPKQDIADYLHNDFFKDQEWWIPKNVKRYRTSKGIKIDLTGFKNVDNIVFGRNIGNETISLTESWNTEILEKFVKRKYNRSLPLNWYLRENWEKLRNINEK